jgi:hypothetical protein
VTMLGASLDMVDHSHLVCCDAARMLPDAAPATMSRTMDSAIGSRKPLPAVSATTATRLSLSSRQNLQLVRKAEAEHSMSQHADTDAQFAVRGRVDITDALMTTDG